MELKLKLISIYIILLCFPTSCNAQADLKNIALTRSYQFSIIPNYKLTEGGDETDLTDGKKKTGSRFWQEKSTVGWSNRKEIQIDLDLGSVHSIDGFLINTARNSGAEVEFPMSCLVFTSMDNSEFEYRGDLMLAGDNSSGGYQVKSFQLMEGGTPGRYVKFVMATKSKFVFLDEIEVFGKESNKTIASLRSKMGSKLVKKTELNSFIENAFEQSAEIRGQYMKIEATRDFMGDLLPSDEKSERKGWGIKDLLKVQEEVSSAKIKAQSKALPEGVLFTPINGMDGLKTFSLNDVVNSQRASNPIVGSEGSFYYFSLINNSSTKESVDFHFSKGDVPGIYEILTVASLNSSGVRDVLRPVVDNKISMEAGEDKFFVVSNAKQNKGGDLKILASGGMDVIGTLSLAEAKAGVNNTEEKLHVNVWAYLDKPILTDNRKFVVNDLEQAGVDVVVVHSAFIDDYKTKDFSKLKSYLRQFENLKNKKVFLFYNLKSNAAKRFNGQSFLDQAWKSNFSEWYTLMQTELTKIGVEELYFYPYDEIKVDEVSNFIDLVKWGKASIPSFKTFVTIIDENTYEAGNYADIVQLSQFHVQNAKNIRNDNIWMYSVLDHSRERSPYNDYRLMPWIAYYYDLKGVGFWNYSALKSNNHANYGRAINGNIDYSVLYLDDDGNVLSSLRWKYFGEGLQDYKILKSYEDQVGKKKMKQIVKNVIDNPEDSELADNALKTFMTN